MNEDWQKWAAGVSRKHIELIDHVGRVQKAALWALDRLKFIEQQLGIEPQSAVEASGPPRREARVKSPGFLSRTREAVEAMHPASAKAVRQGLPGGFVDMNRLRGARQAERSAEHFRAVETLNALRALRGVKSL